MNRRSLLLACLALLAGDAVAAPPTAGVHYLYLIRHGMYDRDEHVTDDRVGNGLNALGREQARLLAARLAALPIKLHALSSSDLKRARETAEELGSALKLKPILDPLLRECTPAPGAVPADAASSCDAQLTELWTKYATPTAGGDTHDALVAHGNVIRWLTMRAIGAAVRRWPALDLANASLTIVAITADGASHLVQYSDASHIPVGKQTWLGPSPGWSRGKLAK